MNLIPKDKSQLLNPLQKQPTVNVIDITQGKPASLAEKIRLLKHSNFTLIIIKYR
jgi:hypothetical protein